MGGSASRRNSGASSRKNCMMHARTTDGVRPTMNIYTVSTAMPTAAKSRRRWGPTRSESSVSKKAQCRPDTANRWLTPASENREERAVSMPDRSPKSSARRIAAAVSSGHTRLIVSRIARARCWGRYRTDPALPGETSGNVLQYSRAKTPRAVKVVISVPLITEASCQ